MTCRLLADMDEEDINAPYEPRTNTAKKLAAVARLPRGAVAICVMTFCVTVAAGLVVTSLFTATLAAGQRGTLSRSKAVAHRDWQKTAYAARHLDTQVGEVQKMADELSSFSAVQGDAGRQLRRNPRSRDSGRDGRDMPFLDPVKPMQQYDQYRRDYRRQERQRRSSKGQAMTAAMQSYIEDAESFFPSSPRSAL